MIERPSIVSSLLADSDLEAELRSIPPHASRPRTPSFQAFQKPRPPSQRPTSTVAVANITPVPPGISADLAFNVADTGPETVSNPVGIEKPIWVGLTVPAV